MVTTRTSTGSLAAPKRKDLYDESDSSEDDIVEKPAKKREKAGSITNAEHSEKQGDSGGRSAAYAAKKKRGRMESLIISPDSKGLLLSRTAQNSSQRNRLRKDDLGKLAQMMKLPVEVFCAIASHLRPDDLLHLSRASRFLYDYFMSKSSRPIWMACVAAMGMPPCPSDLNEPRYASLYFEKACDACGYPRVDKAADALRVRLCKECIKVNVFPGHDLAYQAFGKEVPKMYEIYTLVPFRDMDDTDVPSFRMVNSKIRTRRFLKCDFLEVVGAYLRTKPDSEERKRFVEERHRLVKEVAMHVGHMNTWQITQSRMRSKADEEIKKVRREQIAERLHLLGYSFEEIGSMRSKSFERGRIRESWLRLVCQPKELTDRIWKNIQPKLEELIETKRRFDHDLAVDQERRERKTELVSLYKEYVEFRTSLVPLCFVDLCEIPMVKELIEENGCSVKMTRERWKIIEDELPQLLDRHLRTVYFDCASLLLLAQQKPHGITWLTHDDWGSSDAAGVDAPLDTKIVWQANAFFCGPAPYDISTFENVLSERRSNMLTMLYSPWQSVILQVEGLTFRAASKLLSSLGFAHDITMEHMVSLGVSFVCLQCDPLLQKRMTWQELVAHVAGEVRDYQRLKIAQVMALPLLETHNIERDGASLALLDPHFIGPPVETFTYANHGFRSYCIWCQSLNLLKGFAYREQLAAHMRTSHGIDEALP